MSLTGRVNLTIDVQQREALRSELAEVVDPLLMQIVETLAFGGNGGQANVFWHHRYALTLGEVVDLPLSGGLTDPSSGLTIDFDWVALLYVRVLHGTANLLYRVMVGPAPTQGWRSWIEPETPADHYVVLPHGDPGGVLLLYSPKVQYGTAVGSTNTLRLTNAGPAVDVDVVLVGRGTRS